VFLALAKSFKVINREPQPLTSKSRGIILASLIGGQTWVKPFENNDTPGSEIEIDRDTYQLPESLGI
jgi:hypothetical protein